MRTALLRLCRAYDTADIVADDTTPRTQYGTKALYPHPKGIAVWIDHDDDKAVGHVRELSILEDSYGGKASRWHCALVDADLPDWVKRGTGVSIGTKLLHSYNVGAVEIVTNTILEEVSVLTPTMKPVNPGAQVIHVGPYKPPVSAKAQTAPVARQAAAVRRASAPTRRGDRYLSRRELLTLIDLASEVPADKLGELIATSGELAYPGSKHRDFLGIR